MVLVGGPPLAGDLGPPGPRRALRTLQLGRSGLVVARLPAAREVPGSNHAADSFCVFTKITAIRSYGPGLHTDCSA